MQAATSFVQQLPPDTPVGLLTFSDQVHSIVSVAPMATNRGLLLAAVDNLVSGGGTAVYDATLSGVDEIASLNDTTRINAVVVLTDGSDNESHIGSARLIAMLRQRSESQEGTIRVFTIAYGSSAEGDVLGKIAEASGGKGYSGDPAEIATVYRQISSFF